MTFSKKLLPLLVFVIAAVMSLHEARAVMVARWTLDDNTAGLTNLGTDGATSDLTIPAAERHDWRRAHVHSQRRHTRRFCHLRRKPGCSLPTGQEMRATI